MTVGSLIFRLGDRSLALPLERVVEVFRMVAISTRLLRAPRDCLGLVDFHGQLVPLIDLGARLGLTKNRDTHALVDGQVVVLEDPLGKVGYAVDEVSELSELPLEAVSDNSQHALGLLALGMVRLNENEVIPQLDPAALFSARSRHQLRQALDENTGDA